MVSCSRFFTSLTFTSSVTVSVAESTSVHINSSWHYATLICSFTYLLYLLGWGLNKMMMHWCVSFAYRRWWRVTCVTEEQGANTAGDDADAAQSAEMFGAQAQRQMQQHCSGQASCLLYWSWMILKQIKNLPPDVSVALPCIWVFPFWKKPLAIKY